MSFLRNSAGQSNLLSPKVLKTAEFHSRRYFWSEAPLTLANRNHAGHAAWWTTENCLA